MRDSSFDYRQLSSSTPLHLFDSLYFYLSICAYAGGFHRPFSNCHISPYIHNYPLYYSS
jgi:hypothetical protein